MTEQCKRGHPRAVYGRTRPPRPETPSRWDCRVCERIRTGRPAFPSARLPAVDRETPAARQARRLAAGYCPAGCGPLVDARRHEPTQTVAVQWCGRCNAEWPPFVQSAEGTDGWPGDAPAAPSIVPEAPGCPLAPSHGMRMAKGTAWGGLGALSARTEAAS